MGRSVAWRVTTLITAAKENRLAAASLALALNLKWHCVQFVSWLGKEMGVSTVLSLMTKMLLSKLIALEQTYWLPAIRLISETSQQMNELLLLAGAANTIWLLWTGYPASKSTGTLWRRREKRGSLAVFPPPPLYSRESLLAGCGPAEISIGYLDVLSRPVPVLVKFWLENYITGKLRYIKPRRIKLKKRKGGDKISK